MTIRTLRKKAGISHGSATNGIEYLGRFRLLVKCLVASYISNVSLFLDYHYSDQVLLYGRWIQTEILKAVSLFYSTLCYKYINVVSAVLYRLR